MKLAISNILLVYYLETMIFLESLAIHVSKNVVKWNDHEKCNFMVTRIFVIAMTLARDQGIWMTIKS